MAEEPMCVCRYKVEGIMDNGKHRFRIRNREGREQKGRVNRRREREKKWRYIH